jgi:uncharacterized repeat protein (TIGR02543 family)
MMKKRSWENTLSVILVVLMVFCFLPLAAFADEGGVGVERLVVGEEVVPVEPEVTAPIIDEIEPIVETEPITEPEPVIEIEPVIHDDTDTGDFDLTKQAVDTALRKTNNTLQTLTATQAITPQAIGDVRTFFTTYSAYGYGVGGYFTVTVGEPFGELKTDFEDDAFHWDYPADSTWADYFTISYTFTYWETWQNTSKKSLPLTPEMIVPDYYYLYAPEITASINPNGISYVMHRNYPGETPDTTTRTTKGTLDKLKEDYTIVPSGGYANWTEYNVPEGYEFEGWSTTPEGPTEVFPGGYFPAWTPDNPAFTRDYYAIYKNTAEPVTISYDWDDDTITAPNPDPVEKYPGDPYNELPTPTTHPSGKIFDGWYTQKAPNGIKIITTSIVGDTNTTLYAHWLNPITISFNMNGHGNNLSYANKTIGTGQTIGTLPTLNETDAWFVGWNSQADGLGDAITTNTIFNTTDNVYAIWETTQQGTASIRYQQQEVAWDGEQYNKVINSNSIRTDSYQDVYTYTDRTIVIPDSEIENPYGDDIAWDVTYSPTNKTVTQGETLYVTYTPKLVTITFKNPENGTLFRNESYSGVIIPTIPSYSRTGYKFDGWLYDDGQDNSWFVTAGKAYVYADSISAIDVIAQLTARQDVPVVFYYDITKQKTYTLEEQTYGRILNSFDYTTTEWEPPDNYLFDGWVIMDGELAVPAFPMLLDAYDKSAIATYRHSGYIDLTFEPQNGDEITLMPYVDHTSNYLFPDDPEKTGYTFDGWYTQAVGGDEVVAGTSIGGRTADQTLYAHYTANEYTVTFETGSTLSGADVDFSTYDYTFGGVYNPLPDTSIYGYDFAFWATTPVTGGTIITSSSTVAIADDHNLYSRWSPKHWTVTFDANGGEWTPLADNQTEVYFDSTYFSFPNPSTLSRYGYNFAGWYTDDTDYLTVVTVDTPITTEIGDHSLYAKWEPVTDITVTFNANGKTTTTLPDPTTVTFGSPYGSLPVAAAYGYDFVGWSLTSGGEVIDTTITDVVNDKAHSLYAQWQPASVRVTPSYPDGATFGDADLLPFDIAYGSAYLDELPVGELYGYDFLGWFLDDEFTKKIVISTVVGVVDAHEVYARFGARQLVTYFDPQNGGPAPYMYQKFGSVYALPLGQPAREDYDFVGWFTGIDDGEQVTTSTVVTTEESHTLYAHWQFNKKYVGYTVEYYLNGVLDDAETQIVTNKVPLDDPDTVAVAVDVVNTIDVFGAGYVFDVVTTGTIPTVVNTGDTIKIYYVSKPIEITFDDGDGNLTPITVRYGEPIGNALPVSPYVVHRTFLGWFAGLSLVDSEYIVRETSNFTVVAGWEFHDYTVISQIGEWSGSGSGTTRLNAPHYEFVGLYHDDDCGIFLVPTDAYTISFGSTVITLSEDFLGSLDAGEHRFRAVFENGEVENIIITIAASIPPGEDDTTGALIDADAIYAIKGDGLPRTGDNSLPLVALSVLLAMSGLFTLLLRKRAIQQK